MGFHISTDSVPRLTSYERADIHERRVEPIRGNGRNAGIKPIGKRALTHMTIRRERNVTSPLGNVCMAIMCRLYETDCVTFYEDGSSKLATGGWATQSTIMFIDALIDYHAWVGHAPQSDGKMLYGNHGRKYVWEGSLSLDPDRVPLNDGLCVVHRVNRKAMNEVRRLNAPFKKYVQSMVKVAYPQDAQMSVTNFREQCERLQGLGAVDRGNFPNSRDVDTLCSIMREDNIEDWADALEVFALMTMESRWDGSSSGRWQQAYYYMPQRIAKLVDEVLKYGYADAVFYEVELPRGEYKPNPNAKYVR
jgi:hypothetical protein